MDVWTASLVTHSTRTIQPESPAIATPDETRESWLSVHEVVTQCVGEEKLEERVNADSAKSARSKVRHVTAAPRQSGVSVDVGRCDLCVINGEAVRGDWLACWPRLSIFIRRDFGRIANQFFRARRNGSSAA